MLENYNACSGPAQKYNYCLDFSPNFRLRCEYSSGESIETYRS